MADVTWTPDGEEIFETLIQAVPEPMRDGIKPKLIEMLAARAAGEPVSRETVISMVEEDMPEPQRSALMAALGIGQQDDNADSGPALPWTGKSEAMFEVMLNEVPEAMRGIFREKLTAVITQKSAGGDIIEDHVTAVVNEIVPEPFKSTILAKFKEVGDFDPKIIVETIARHGKTQDKLSFILHDLQDAIGYLPTEAIQAVSNNTGIALSTVCSIISFYKAFQTDPPGKIRVKLCCGTACHLKDTDGIAAYVRQKAADNPDVRIEETLCLGMCDCAPAVEINGRVFTGDDVRAQIDTLLG